MHRFRKKSDAKRAQAAEFQEVLPVRRSPPQDPLPALPPVSDFRTSLILPDLTRRFSVLRNSAGSPIRFDDLKAKFAEQRARGSENQVTEEEEDMILEALGRIQRSSRSRDDKSANRDGNDATAADTVDGSSRMSASPSLAGSQSIRSTTSNSLLQSSSSAASIASSKASQSQYSRRMSNNLFGSGKFRDHSYMRTQRTRTESTRSSSTPSDSNATSSTVTSRAPNNASSYMSMSDSQSVRPVTPENNSTYTSSAPASPNSQILAGSTSGAESIVSSQGVSLLARTLPPDNLKRASLALDEVIRELEEEGDDEIVMERFPINRVPSPSVPRLPQNEYESSPSPLPPSPANYDASASSSDEQIVVDAEDDQRASPIPSTRATSPAHGRLPGYIPGMPRPMTPHDTSLDYDDQTPSATPRATSPRLPGTHGITSASAAIASNMYRSNSSASTSRHTTRATSPTSGVISPQIPIAPLILNRSTNGRFTPEDRSRSATATPPTADPMDSPVLGRRRPVSPLSAPAFQPLASAATASNSRPSTPSNVIWNVPPSAASSTGQHGRNESSSGHSKEDSLTSVGMTSGDEGRSPLNTNGRRIRSPPLPGSPTMDNVHGFTGGFSVESDYRPGTPMSHLELGSPIQMANRPLRSPTPTNNGIPVSQSPPASPNFPEFNTNSQSSPNINGSSGFSPSRRSSRQTGGHHSSFSLGSTHALLLSPIANSSHSSLESAGSSYHSWDEDHKKDRLFTLFNQLESEHKEWHDITVSVHDKSASSSGSTSHDTAEKIVKRDIGLSKNDIINIQERLVNAALAKAATPEGRHRSSSIRRRRPSTSQSNYSNPGGESRVASPAPQVQSASPVVNPVRSPDVAKVNALLDSMVNSIQAEAQASSPKAPVTPVGLSPPQPAVSTPTQRHRALADALFGVQDRQEVKNASEVQTAISPAAALSPSAVSERADSSRTITMSRSNSSARDLTTPASSDVQTPSKSSSALDHSQMDASLLFEVQRRAEAATAALRKSPSNPKLVEAGGTTKKRISPNQISSPKLVSASTSVDAIPLHPSSRVASPAQPSGSSSTKFGSRFKKLRGTLRAKPQVPNGEEVTPFPLDLNSPSPSQTLTFSPNNLSVPGDPAIFSASESTQFRVSPPVLPNPPASAGPTSSFSKGGFFSRFRKQRQADVSPARDHRQTPSSASSSSPPGSATKTTSPQAQSTRAGKTQYFTTSPRALSPPTIPEDVIPVPDPIREEAALQQLFDAANNLGLDQDALNQILARSPSTTSRSTAWTKITRSASVADKRRSQQRANAQSPSLSEGRPSMDAPSPRPSTEIKQLNIRKHPDSSIPRLRPDGDSSNASASNAIVRRTIIYPSDTRASNVDWNAFIRKQSTSRRRSSLQSNRSVHDRAPTPPPPKSTGGKRFSSNESSPPVPQLPHSFNIPDISLPPGQMEKSNSAYDSLYDMYAGDSKVSGPSLPDSLNGGGQQPESSQALEIVELANGETIWSIVNGLRDDDGESFYGDRASFTSEYSVRDNEAVRVLFKEHGRKSSKGSSTSFISRKRQTMAASRPETKVFVSSSAQIGRLIENLSRGTDAGSFNISPDGHVQHRTGHSASPSVGSITVEERLEQMLGSMSSHPYPQ